MVISKPRECALKVLYDIDKNGAYLNIALRGALGDYAMDSRDGALATQIVMGVTRHRLFLDEFIASLSSVKLKKMSVWILNILRIGFYSNVFLDKIPRSATVNECVTLARRYGHASSAAFVNAVLRASEGKTFSVRDWNVKYSYPEWIIDKWKREKVQNVEALLAAGNETPPVTVRKNTLIDAPVPDCMEHAECDAYYYRGKGSFEGTPWQQSGAFAVCDTASQRAVRLLAPKRGERVLDLCAAPGGKSAYAAALMENEGEIISCDIHPHKIAIIENTAKHLNARIIRPLLNDALIFHSEFENAFDAVLLDAPCSGLGIIRRKPDIKWTKAADDCATLCNLQHDMLTLAARYVKRGGRLLYSTCTISLVENEDNTERFLSENPDFELVSSQQLMTHIDNTDGFYTALFRRKDNELR